MPFCPIAMPKATATKSIRKNTIIARNEPIGLLERITISPDTRAKFAEVGKRKPVPRAATPPSIRTPSFTPEESAELIDEFMQECARNALLSFAAPLHHPCRTTWSGALRQHNTYCECSMLLAVMTILTRKCATALRLRGAAGHAHTIASLRRRTGQTSERRMYSICRSRYVTHALAPQIASLDGIPRGTQIRRDPLLLILSSPPRFTRKSILRRAVTRHRSDAH